MGDDRTAVAAAEASPQTISGAQADWTEGGAVSDSVRAQDGPAVGALAAGTGVGVGDDGMASAARLAEAGRVEKDPCRSLGQLAGGRPDRLVPSGRRFFVGPRDPRGKKTGPNPTDRGKPGSKHHLITDAKGIPLAATLSGANAHDVTQLLPLVEAIPPVSGKPGRPRRRPQRVQGDRAYDSQSHRNQLRQRGIEPVLAKRNTEHGSGLGVNRWVVERTISWLHQMRRLRTRYDRRDDIHEAFLTLGCIVICSYFL